MKSLKVIIPVACLTLLSACQTQQIQQNTQAIAASEPKQQQSAPPLPFKDRPSDLAELDQDIIFNYLAAEISAQRGALKESFEYYLHTAIRTRDDHAAERATKIALHIDDKSAALRASRLWVDISPNSIAARKACGLLELSDGRLDAANVQFDALIKIANATNRDGYLIIGRSLVGSQFQSDNVRLMRLILEKHMDAGNAHYALALIEADAKLYADAFNSLDSAIRLRPEWDLPRILQASILERRGQTESALRLLQAAIKDLPDSIELHIVYSRKLIQLTRYQSALSVLVDAAVLDPLNTEVLLAKGLIETELKLFPAARETWQTLRNIRFAYDEATYYLAQTEELDGQLETAMGLYASVKAGALHTDAQIHLAQLLMQTGQTQKARELFVQMRVLDPDRSTDIYTLEARALAENDMIEAALQLYQAAIAVNPGNIDLRYNRGILASENDGLTLAIADFEFILKQQPDNVNTLNALGYTLADQTDRYPEAYIYILKAYKLKPDSPAILDSLGWVYYRMGNLPEALKYLQLANQQLPDAEIAAHLGEVLWASGDQAQAQKIWQDALLREPESGKLNEVMQRLQ